MTASVQLELDVEVPRPRAAESGCPDQVAGRPPEMVAAAVARGGHCVPCAGAGHATLARAGTDRCDGHHRFPDGVPAGHGRAAVHRVTSSKTLSSRRPRRPGRPRPPRRVLTHTPRRTGSRRVASMRRLEVDARQLVRQAAVARHQHRVLAWLAGIAWWLDTTRPAGAGKADARRNVMELAALWAVSADWGSGRRGRPGRRLSAALAGLSERTVERHWQLLECARWLRGTPVEARLLPTGVRVEVQVDVEERERTADRKECRLGWPWWMREVTEDQLWPYVAAARAVLDTLADRIRPIDGVPAGQDTLEKSVAPSLRCTDLRPVALRGGTFTPAPRSSSATEVGGPNGREEQRRATRSSPKSGGSRIRPPVASWAGLLAAQLVRDERLPCLRGASTFHVATVLETRVGCDWTVDDVVDEALARLVESTKSMVSRPKWAPSYLDWLLERAVKSEPPAQIRAYFAAAARALAREKVDRDRVAAEARAAAWTPPADSGGHAYKDAVLAWIAAGRVGPPPERAVFADRIADPAGRRETW